LRITKFVRYLPEFGWSPEVLTVRRPLGEKRDHSLLGQLPENLPIHDAPAFYYRRFEKGLLSAASTLKAAIRGKKGPGPAETTGDGEAEDHQEARSVESRATVSFPRRIYRMFRDTVEFPDAHAGWIPAAVYKGLRLCRERKFDAIFVSTPPHSSQLVASLLGRLTGIPVVCDLRDPWADLVYFAHRPARKRAMRTLERWVFGRASSVVLNTPPMRDMVAASHPEIDPVRFHAIPNGFDSDDFSGATEYAGPRPWSSDDLLAMHVGTVYDPWGSPTELFDALARLRDRTPELIRRLKVVFIGSGNALRSNKYRRAIEDAGLDGKIELIDFVPHSHCVQLMRSASVLFLVQNSPHTPTQVASKLYEYLFAGPPVLAITTSLAAVDVVRRTGGGIALPPGDSQAIASAFETLVTESGDIPPLDRDAVLSFERRALTRRLAGILDAVAEVEREGEGAR
jgi:hypothetical protein